MNRVVLSATLLLVAATLSATAQTPSQTPSPPPSQVSSTPAGAPADDAAAADAPPSAVASQVRIVRLSQVRGVASIQRSAGEGFAPAFANIPVITGARLRTAAGVAEVEFEDGSTLRLTPHSEVDFAQLGRTAAGSTVSQLEVVGGSVYVSLARTRDAVFTLASGKATMQLRPGSHMRLDVSAPEGEGSSAGPQEATPGSTPGTSLAQAINAAVDSGATPNAALVVFDGEVDFGNAAGHTTVTRKRTLNFNSLTGGPPVLDAGLAPAPFDAWDKEGVQYQKRYLDAGAFAGSGFAFGSSDLNYYGSFVNMPGCGSLWRPYFASTAWDPFDNGIWAWYGNAGYSWVSPYPWGWLPFHTGSWQFCGAGGGGAGGWGWRPGGAWYGLYNHPRLFRPIYGVKPPPRPPLPPSPGHPRLVAASARPLPASGLASGLASTGAFTFRKDSAGFGVPREGFHHLGHESAVLDRKGSAQTSLDLQRYALPASNLPPRSMTSGTWAMASPADRAGSRAAWAASHAGAATGAPGRANAGKSTTAGAGWSGAPREGSGSNSAGPGTAAPVFRPAPSAASSPSYHSAPAPSAPSFHSAPASAPSAAPSAGAAHSK